ncbi:MAG: DUF1345 domain-containing protein, partial [Bacteroidetes bacterium]|nr:DUF1345 domain-containing protein [Bacteroidota bacterium]
MTGKLHEPTHENIFVRMRPIHRLLISTLISVAVFFIFRECGFGSRVLSMLIWDSFALTYLIMAWIVLCNRNTEKMRELAKKEDNSRLVISILIIAACFASMFMVLLLILSKDKLTGQALPLIVAVSGVLLSWIMLHTIFTFHYAMMYYDDDESDPNQRAEGLDFPGDEKHPDYLDFAYFAFVIGMT